MPNQQQFFAPLTENAVDVLQGFGAIFWMIVITVVIADYLSPYVSNWRTYPSLIVIDIVFIVLLGLNKPFGGLWGTFLIWSVLGVPFSAWVLLYAKHQSEYRGVPYYETFIGQLPAGVGLAILFWVLFRR